jgi:lipoprotein-anchoring transpeptidase ErfK/SrfK
MARRILLPLLLLAAFMAAPLTAAQGDGEELNLDLAPEMIPPQQGQTTRQVYIRETGHTISGIMLDYWRANGGSEIYGNPISEPYAAPNGYYSQAFQRGIFQWRPDFAWTEDPAVRLAPAGADTAKTANRRLRADGRRAASDRRADTWRPVAESEERSAEVWNDGGVVDESSGYAISGAFLDWYTTHEGVFYLGDPISQPHRARGVTAQYFEGGVLLEADGEVWLAPLPAEHPWRFDIDTTKARQGNIPTYHERIFARVPNPGGVNVLDLSGRRRIEISLSQQTLWAYQGDDLVLETFVSTGLDPNTTETGNFHVRIKVEKQDMQGFTDSSGEVVAVGDDGTNSEEDTIESLEPGQERYEVKDVPHVMYINSDAEALHGAYWHNNFGYQMSHGCINLPLDVAAFLYTWAPLGTAVTVYE